MTAGSRPLPGLTDGLSYLFVMTIKFKAGSGASCPMERK